MLEKNAKVEPAPTKACEEVAAICWMESHPGMAAWAQFSGATLALVVALVVAILPIFEARRARREDQQRMLSRAVHAALTAEQTISACVKAIEKFPANIDDAAIRESVTLALARLETAASAPIDGYRAEMQLTSITLALRTVRECTLGAIRVAADPEKLAQLLAVARAEETKTQQYASALIKLAQDAGVVVRDDRVQLAAVKQAV